MNHFSVFRVRVAAVLSAALALLSLGGCSMSRLSQEWRDPLVIHPLKNILVIVPKNNPVYRRLWEDAFVSGLTEQGAAAAASYRFFGDAVPDTGEVDSIVNLKNFDGVIFVTRLESSISTNYVPGAVQTEVAERYSRWKKRYETVYKQVEQPGYTDTATIVRNEIDVYATAGDGGMIWTAVGESLDPSSGAAVKEELTNLVIPELANQGIIPSKM